MNGKNRNFLFLLLTLLVGTLLFSCAGPGDPVPTDGPADTVQSSAADSGSPAAPGPEPFRLTENGECCCTVIRSDDADDATAELALNLRNKLQKKLGVEVKLNSDLMLTAGGASRDDAYDILVGFTSCTQAAQLQSSLRSRDAVVTLRGRKLLILAQNRETLNKAVNWFLNYALPQARQDAAGNWSLIFDTYELHGEYELPALTLGGRPVTDYRIVYSSRDPMYREAAQEIAGQLGLSSGYTLPLFPDTEPAQPLEITVGPTSRLSADGRNGAYTVRFSGERLVFEVMGVLSAREAAGDLIASLKEKGTSDIPAELVLSKTWADTERVPLADGADARIMSFNVLSQRYNTVDYTDRRAELLGLLLEKYRPDAAGLQEACVYWRRYLEIYGGSYRVIGAARPDGGENYSLLIYDADRYDVIDSGVLAYSQGSSAYNANLTYGIFRSRDGQKTFGLISTHWSLNGENNEGEAQRRVQADELTALVRRLQDGHGCPIYAVGDFNCKPDSASMNYFRSVAPLWDGRAEPGAARNSFGTVPGFQKPAAEGGSVIDYVFGTRDSRCLSYFVIPDGDVEEISDHRPVFGDVTLP